MRFKCKRCPSGHEWTPRGGKISKVCPNCHSKHWQTEKKGKKEK